MTISYPSAPPAPAPPALPPLCFVQPEQSRRIADVQLGKPAVAADGSRHRVLVRPLEEERLLPLVNFERKFPGPVTLAPVGDAHARHHSRRLTLGAVGSG